MGTWRSAMPDEYQPNRAGCVDWKKQLLEIGGVDLLSGTPLEPLANNPQCPFWLISVPNVLDTDTWRVLSLKSAQMMQDADKLGKPQTPKDEENFYRSINASQFPCTCEYWYGGWTEKNTK